MTCIGWNIFVVFLLFQSILGEKFELPRYYAYWDEALLILLIMLWLLKLMHDGLGGRIFVGKKTVYLAVPWLYVIIIGIIGNIAFEYAYLEGLVRDIIGFLKFPIGFIMIRELKWDEKIAKALQKAGFWWFRIVVIIIFVFGILSLFDDYGMCQEEIRGGIHPYQFLFGHPTTLVTVSVMLICFFTVEINKQNNLPYIIMLLLTIVLCMRTKGLAFIAAFIFMKYGSSWIKKYKIIYWLGISAVAFLMSYSKLQLYMSFSTSGREVLWVGAFTLLRMCIPFGSGFGSFASDISGRYHSKVYNIINSTEFWNQNGDPTSVLGDAGFPYYIGQFGIIGIIFLSVAVWRMLHIWHSSKNDKLHNGLSEDLLMVYIAIALTSEAILLNYGIELGVVLAVLLKLDERGLNSDSQKTKN